MASPSTTINANLNINPASVKSSQKKVQSAFSNINLNSKSVSQFSNSLGRITGQATEFKKSMDAATARVFAFGATAAVINSISQSFRALVASTIEVEKRLIEINSIFGATEKQFASFRKSIFEVAKNTGQSFAVVADGAAELARQGLSAEETAKRLNASLILTRVSGLDAVSSVNSLTAALNGFTSAGLTAESVVNKIIAVDTAFAVSAKDLAEGFQRAGSTAEDAGVSFDELLGLITAVQQKTARGGAVIGNAFKSIFTRLSRGTTISELQSLGVEIDASQSGVKKLQALSSALENVADPNVASQIKELAGGVFQINVVSAALKDLSNETSIFADAASKSAAASNEAFSKNEALNKSLAAQINTLIVSATNLAEKLGQLTLAPVISDLTSLATKFTGFLSNALDEDSGNALIKGFFKGIATFIQGPGIILVTGAFLNIFKIVARFAKEGFQDLLRIGSGQEKIKSIEAGIVQLLSQDATLRKQLVSTTLSQAQKEQLVIQAIQRENALLREQQAILAGLAASAARAGVTGFGVGRGFSGKRGRGFASGFTPIEGAMEVAEARSLGARGTVRPRLSKGTIGGRKFIMNSQETEIPNFGKNGDSAVIPHYAQGFVPNFNLERAGANQLKEALRAAKSEGVGSFQGKPYTLAQVNAEVNRRASQSKLIGSQENRLRVGGSNEYPFLVPSKGAIASGDFQKRIQGSFKRGKDTVYYTLTDGAIRAFSPNLGGLDEAADPHDARIQEKIENSIVEGAFKYAQLLKPLGGNKSSESDIKERLNVGAVNAAVGTAFEAAVLSAIDSIIDKKNARFDVPSFSGREELIDLFSLPKKFAKKAADLKATGSKSNIDSFVAKLASRQGTGAISKVGKPVVGKTTKARAAGYIPNFADPLGEAISRETSGTGISKSQVRISNDKRLANKSNPLGLAVTNTRDEPNGLRDVFAGGFVPNFQKGKKDRGDTGGGLGAGLGASLVFSLLIPQIETLGQKGNSAAKELEELTKEQERLEKQLEAVNKETDPERFSELTLELRKLSVAQKEATQSSQEYSNTLNNTLAFLNTAILVGGQLGGILGGGAGKTATKTVGKTLQTGVGELFGSLVGSAVGGKLGGGGFKQKGLRSPFGGKVAKAARFGRAVTPAAGPVLAALAVQQASLAGQERVFSDLDARTAARSGSLPDFSGDQFREDALAAIQKDFAGALNPFEAFEGFAEKSFGGKFVAILDAAAGPVDELLTALSAGTAVFTSSAESVNRLSEKTQKSLDAGLLDILDEDAFAAKAAAARTKITQEVSGLVNVFEIAANKLPDSTIKFQSELDRFKEAVAVGGKDFNLKLKKAFIDKGILDFDFGLEQTPAQRRRKEIDKVTRSTAVSRELLSSATGRDLQGIRQQLETSRKSQISNLANLEGFEELGIQISDFANKDISSLREEFNKQIKDIRGDRNLLARIESFAGRSDAPEDVVQAQRLLDQQGNINTIFDEADRINKSSLATAKTIDKIGADLQTSLETDDADLFNDAIEGLKNLQGVDASDVFKGISARFEQASELEFEKRIKIVEAIDAAGQQEIDARKKLFEKLKTSFDQNLKNFETLGSPSAIRGALSPDADRSEINELLKQVGITQAGRSNAVLASTPADFVNSVLRGAGTEIPELLETLGTSRLTEGQSALFSEINESFKGSGARALGLAGAGTEEGRVLTISGARDIQQLIESREGISSAEDIRERLRELSGAGSLLRDLSPTDAGQKELQKELGVELAAEIAQLEDALKLILSTATEDQMLVQLEAIAANTSLLVRQFENDIVDSLRGAIAVDSDEGRALAATFEPQAQANENKVREENNEKLAQINQKEQENREKIAAEEEKIATSLANVSSALESAVSRISGEGSLDATPNIV